MRLTAALEGNLEKYMAEELKSAENAMMRGMRQATDGLKNEMRAQTISAGLGNRLARTWRGNVYPKRTASLNPSGLVYTRASYILYGLETGEVIRAKGGSFLAVPTENASKKVMYKRVTPGNYERARGTRLDFVYNPGGTSFLVDNQAVASYSRKTGQLRGYRKASKSALKTGKSLASIIVFWLVPSVRRPKKISFYKTSDKWQKLFPSLALSNWRSVT